jgi:hypothetical protein
LFATNPILLLQLGFALLFLLSLLLRLALLELLLLAQLFVPFHLLAILLQLRLSFHFSLLRLPPFQLLQSLLLTRWPFLWAGFLPALILLVLLQLRFALFFVSLVLFLTIQFLLLLSLPFPLRCLFFLSLAITFLLCRRRSYSSGDPLVRLRWRRLLGCIEPFGALEGFMDR